MVPQGQFMELDLAARRNLELTETLRGKEKKGSLLWVLDKTKTPMGARNLRMWLQQPLMCGRHRPAATPWRRWWMTPSAGRNSSPE